MSFDQLEGSISPDGITIATHLADDNHDWEVSEIGKSQKKVMDSLKNNVNSHTETKTFSRSP